MLVLAMAVGGSVLTRATTLFAHAPEQGVEKLAALGLAEASARTTKTIKSIKTVVTRLAGPALPRLPSRRRTKFLPCMLVERSIVVSGAFFGVF